MAFKKVTVVKLGMMKRGAIESAFFCSGLTSVSVTVMFFRAFMTPSAVSTTNTSTELTASPSFDSSAIRTVALVERSSRRGAGLTLSEQKSQALIASPAELGRAKAKEESARALAIVIILTMLESWCQDWNVGNSRGDEAVLMGGQKCLLDTARCTMSNGILREVITDLVNAFR